MWANYVKGVIANFKGKLSGFDAVINTTVPVGGGLSSSAALEVATFLFLEELNSKRTQISIKEKAFACQYAEHQFLGMPCGIMDQFISLMGKKDNALLLDCRSLEYKLVEMKDPNVSILITNTNVHHKLAESQYSKRKNQCEKAAEVIGKSSLRDVSLQELNDFKPKLGEDVYRRALHVVTEIQRTLDAFHALQNENYKLFGILMQQSHQSLRNNYEVSCQELDEVVEAALEINGVYGARMTGGGFGGCTVTLLLTEVIEKTMKNIEDKYSGTPTFYICRPGDGANIVA